jgi:hypothetical protein
MCFDIKLGLRVLLLLACAACTACTPELNWRDSRAGAGKEASEVALQFPCKPSRAQRNLVLGDSGQAVSFTLTGCNAAQMSFALGAADLSINAADTNINTADLADPQRIQATLAWMARKLTLNINATAAGQQPFAPQGASANSAAIQATLTGTLPDGTAVTERIAVFARGQRVYQATVMAPAGKLKAEAADQFFTSIALTP